MDSKIVELARTRLSFDINRYYPRECDCNTCQLARAVIAMAEFEKCAYELLDCIELEETSTAIASSYGLDTYSVKRYEELRKSRGESFGVNVPAYRALLDRLRRSAEGGK